MKNPKKINIANIPTPIENMSFNGCSFLMKRDDLTGSELSGNKIRKLEYLLYEAKKQNAEFIITCGGEQSNHCRASVIAAAKLGIKSILFLWGKEKKIKEGNSFFYQVYGARQKYLNWTDYQNVNSLMEREKLKLSNRGIAAYSFPSGGSSPLGIWGYIKFIPELSMQLGSTKIKGILSAAGSGGTAAGMLVGSALSNLNWKIFAVNVLDTKEGMENEIISVAEKCVRKYNLKIKLDYSKLEILDGYSREGYKKIAPSKIKVIKNFARRGGVLFDPAYTGKAFYAYNENFLKNKMSSSIIFLHTGGIFGAFSKKRDYLSL